MYLLFDIGGTKTRVSSSPDLKDLGQMKVIDSLKSYKEGLVEIEKISTDFTDPKEVKGVCVGIAGPFNNKKGSLVGSPNLSDWIDKPLKDDLQSIFPKADIYIENDSALVALGEANHGAGKGHKIVAYITVSTGVGGARVISGQLDDRAIGFEPGHQIIDAGGALCPDCRGPYLGYYISGHALEKRGGIKPKEIEDNEVWNDLALKLAYGLNNTIVHWSPDIVVLGGSMITGNPAIPLDVVRDNLKEILKIYGEVPPVSKATLGDEGGLWGGLSYLRQNLKEV